MSCRYHDAVTELDKLTAELSDAMGDKSSEDIAWELIDVARKLRDAACACGFSETGV